jgi:hypothetical protein
MIQQTALPELELGGSAQEQALAREVWMLMRMRGISYAADRPISARLDQIVEFLVGRKYNGLEDADQIRELVESALSASRAVFERLEDEETVPGDDEAAMTRKVVTFRTTKAGKSPGDPKEFDHHSFRFRLRQDVQDVIPETVEETAARQVEQSHLPALNLPVAAQPTQQAAAPVVQQPAARPATPPPATPQPAQAAPAPVQPATRPAAQPAPPQQPAVQPAANARPAAQQPAQPATRPAAQPAPTTGPIEIEVADGVTVDLNRPSSEVLSEYGDYFASALLPAIQEDFRFVSFLDHWYLDESTGRFSKGDFRRIRETMNEINEPLSDDVILKEIWGKRRTDQDYEATRFALNYRLLKEKKDFEFVGTREEAVWTIPGMFQIGSQRHKPTEIGTDYKFLEDPNLVEPSEIVETDGKKTWRHTLTFYEHENGVLPYDATAREFFPKPVFDEQKSVILRFEAPQTYTTYPAELRLPSGNRGGWIGGLEQFFEDNLVPGAILVISQGNRDNHFLIEYEQGQEQEVNVLLYDDRRQKFVFRPVVLACQLNPEQSLTPERYSKLNSRQRMDDADRKKTDQVLMGAFELAGQRTSNGYHAKLNDLFPVANIERPFSKSYLRQLLTHGNSQFQPDENTPDAFWYRPPQTGIRR